MQKKQWQFRYLFPWFLEELKEKLTTGTWLKDSFEVVLDAQNWILKFQVFAVYFESAVFGQFSILTFEVAFVLICKMMH